MSSRVSSMVERDSFALVIIDIQERLADAMDRREEVVALTGKLARVAAMLSAPVIVTRQYPRGLGSTVPELDGLLGDLAEGGANVDGIDKTAFCCAAETEFTEKLRATGRKQVVLVGMETHICVTQTALALAEDGYVVHIASDACCSRDARLHDTALDRLRTAGVVVSSTESVMYEAVGRAGTPEFKELLGIVKE